jgi:Protein of unknown function (DUF2809)
MKCYFTFNKKYFALTILLLGIEILIAKYMHDDIIRPYGGDVLVVILIYCFVKSFWHAPVWPTALSVLLFAFVIEGLQYVKIVNILGLQHNKIASVVIGTSFAWMDIVCYIMGIAIVLGGERLLRSQK